MKKQVNPRQNNRVSKYISKKSKRRNKNTTKSKTICIINIIRINGEIKRPISHYNSIEKIKFKKNTSHNNDPS
jgi:hypothetical protein